MKRFVLLLVTTITLFSCKSPYVSEIAGIDSLLVALDSAKIKLHKLDTGLVYQRIREANKNLNFITNKVDSVNKEQGIALDTYHNSRKYYSRLSERFPALFEQVETIPMQLKNLRNDLSKNLIEKDLAEKYYTNELTAAHSVIENIDQITERMVSLNESYEQSREKILLLIQSVDTTNTED